MVWGPRSATRRDSPWLLPPVLLGNPVGVRAFRQVPTRDWLVPTSGEHLPVAHFFEHAESTFVLPTPLPAAVALDFDLRVGVGGATGSGLRLRQLFTVGPGGSLMPSRYARRDVTATAVPHKGVALTDKPLVELVGTHPLLSVTSEGVKVDAEFLDVTELWWGLRNAQAAVDEPRGDWYTHPALGGHPERLRALAATTPGKGPSFWLVWASRAAAGQARKVQPLVFLIAPAWLNDGQRFAHEPTPAGLVKAAGSGKPMYAVGRFLLSPVLPDRLDAARKATPPIPEQHLWQLARDVLKQTMPVRGGGTWPEKLLEVAPGGGATPRAVLPLHTDLGHRPAGHEAAADDSGKPLLLVYPVGVDGVNPYASVTRPGLAERMRSMVGAMFGAGAVAVEATAAPAMDDLVLAGHSGGNGILWGALAANGSDVAKCVTFDAASVATPENNLDSIRAGVAKRGTKPFSLVLVTSTNSYGTPADLATRVSKVRAALRGDPAAMLVVLPAETAQAAFWNPANAAPSGSATANPLLRAMLAPWSDAEIHAATTPGNRRFWNFLFFHEFAAYGGQSPTRTFFREALDL